jgi:hypothetical protein
MTEKQPYEVTKSFKEFELRHYPAGMQIETIVQGDFINAGSMGFRPLVNFISGNNARRQSIAMTAPVIQQPSSGSGHSIRFVLPADMDIKSTPDAADPSVKVLEVPAHNAAARKFSGAWSEDRFEAEGKALLEALSSEGFVTEGSLYFSRFDPPWKPGFLKRNEVLIRVKK